MAMGKRRRGAQQKAMWVGSTDLPQSAGHPFYQRLNQVLDDAGFDAFVEHQCAPVATADDLCTAHVSRSLCCRRSWMRRPRSKNS
tara:strand:+ start:385 stop:639 length:255 start_codon:yes stop_codon:yes gene_type:complete